MTDAAVLPEAAAPGRKAMEAGRLLFAAPSRFIAAADVPGYGYAAVGHAEARGWAETINFYLGRRAVLAGAVLMIDARHGMKDGDRAALELLAANGVSCIAVLTKIDKLKPAARPAMMAEVAAELARYPAAFPALHAVSAHDGFGIPELRGAIAALAASRAGR